jgi:type IV secretory pathway protease TraF
MSRARWIALGVCLWIVGMIMHTQLTGQHTTFNLTGSLPQWAFSCRPYHAGQPLTAGMYIRFAPPPHVQELLRAVGVVIHPKVRWVKRVKEVWHEEGRETVVFVEGTHPRSFDSRQWGPLVISDILERCEPW